MTDRRRDPGDPVGAGDTVGAGDARDTVARRRADAAHRPLPPGPAWSAGLLLAVPVVVLLLVPIYARSGPTLFGFPFFYWFQLVWVVAAAVFTSLAFAVVTRARRTGGRR